MSYPVGARMAFVASTPFAYDELIVGALLSMYDPVSWVGPDSWTDYFAYLADAAAQRDSTAGARAARVRSATQARLTVGAAQQELYSNSFDAGAGVNCADVEYPRFFETFSLIGEFAAYQSTFGPLWWWNSGTMCAAWPVDSDRYVGPWEVRTSAPVLLVGNYFDGVTDYANAVATNKLLKNSRLLSFAGWGHTAFGESTATACVTEHIVGYLFDGTLPPEGTVCPAPPNPWSPTLALRAAPAGRPVVRPPSWLLRRF